jgi:hypothetical protein
MTGQSDTTRPFRVEWLRTDVKDGRAHDRWKCICTYDHEHRALAHRDRVRSWGYQARVVDRRTGAER